MMDVSIVGAQNAFLDSKITNAQNRGQGLAGLDKSELEKAAEDFEAIFLSQMIRPMFDGLETDGMFGGGHAEKVYRSMFIDEVAEEIAASGSVGISDSIKRDLLALQEV